MSRSRLNRRDFLRAAVAVSAGALAAACAPAATPTSAPPKSATPTSAPTVVPATQPASKEKVKISMSIFGAPFEDKLYTDFYIPNFKNERPDIEVEFLKPQDYIADIIRLTAAGTPPDVIRHAGTQLEWAHAGIFGPLDDLMAAAKFDKNDFVEATWKGSTFKGKIYGISQSPNFLGLWYNKDILDQEGMPYPDETYTIDKLMADAKALTKKDASGQVVRYGYTQDWAAAPFIIGSWIYSHGGRLMNEAGTDPVFDTPEVVEAFTNMRRMVQDGSATNAAALGKVGTIEFFTQGKAALFGQGTHMASIGTSTGGPNVKFAATTWPKGKVRACVATDVGFGLAGGSKNKPQAFDFMAYILNKPNLLEYWQQLWVALPARKSVFNDPAIRNIKGIPNFSPSLTRGDEEFKDKVQWEIDTYNANMVYLDWNSPWLAKMNPILGEVMSGVTLPTDPADPAKVVKDAQAKFVKIIQDNPL